MSSKATITHKNPGLWDCGWPTKWQWGQNLDPYIIPGSLTWLVVHSVHCWSESQGPSVWTLNLSSATDRFGSWRPPPWWRRLPHRSPRHRSLLWPGQSWLSLMRESTGGPITTEFGKTNCKPPVARRGSSCVGFGSRIGRSNPTCANINVRRLPPFLRRTNVAGDDGEGTSSAFFLCRS